MALYPFNPFAGHKIQGVAGTVPPKRGFIAHYDETPGDAAGAGVHGSYTLAAAAAAMTSAAANFLATAAATDVTLELDTSANLAVGDVLQDAAETGELVLVTAKAADAVTVTVTRGFAGTTKATHLTGATWNQYGEYVVSGITSPTVPRNVTILANEADMNTAAYIIGTDMAGAALVEAITMAGIATIAGAKAFKTVAGIVYPVQKDAGETLGVGWGVKLGLPHKLDSAARVLVKLFDKSTDAGTVTASASDLAANVFDVAGTMNGLKHVELFYLVN